MNACQWASMRPGMSTRPLAAITRTLAFASIVIGPAEMRAMVLPRTRTLEGAESVALLPSKMRTFRKSVGWGLAGVANGAKPGASKSASPCAKLTWQKAITNADANMSVGPSANPDIRVPVRASSIARFTPQVVLDRWPVTFAINFCPATFMIYTLSFQELALAGALDRSPSGHGWSHADHPPFE